MEPAEQAEAHLVRILQLGWERVCYQAPCSTGSWGVAAAFCQPCAESEVLCLFFARLHD